MPAPPLPYMLVYDPGLRLGLLLLLLLLMFRWTIGELARTCCCCCCCCIGEPARACGLGEMPAPTKEDEEAPPALALLRIGLPPYPPPGAEEGAAPPPPYAPNAFDADDDDEGAAAPRMGEFVRCDGCCSLDPPMPNAPGAADDVVDIRFIGSGDPRCAVRPLAGSVKGLLRLWPTPACWW